MRHNNNNRNNNNNFKNNINYSYAPYNFIPLSKRVIERYKGIEYLPGHDEFVNNTLSGEIEYTIENVTDLIISNGNGKFFKNVDNNYAIPGSTIRGKLRSNISTLGFSAIAQDIEDERFLYRRFASNSSNLNKEYNDRLGMKIERVNGKSFSILKNVNAGYVKKISDEEYVIIKSKTIKGRTYFRISEKDLIHKYNGMKGINFMNDKRKTQSYEPYTREVSFEVNENNNGIKSIGEKNQLKNNGYILGSGSIYKKQSHYIINEIDSEKDNENDYIRLSVDDIRIYKKYYIKDKKSKLNSKGFYSLPENRGDIKPIFYVEYNGKVYFGFTQYLRLFYDKSIYDGIPDVHKRDIFDYKKSIFGFINTKKGYKSRVSVEDAVVVGNVKTRKHTMVLGEPKATCVHLYLKQDGDRSGLHSYNGEFEIRGIKYYWLKEFVSPEEAKGNVNTIEEAIENGARFKGRIKFNNLNEDELGLLVWALYIHKDANQNIGKGKPYGFGNIKIKDISIKVQDTNKKYNNIFEENIKNLEVIECIEKYKDYVKGYFSDLDDIEDDLAIKTFIEVHKNTNRVEPVSYMSLKKENDNKKTYNEFSLYNPLSEPFEVLGIKNRKAINNTKNIKNNYKTNYTKQNSNTSNYNSKGHNKNKNTSVYNDGELSNNPFAILQGKFN